jgi:predicted metal-dependent hydrolase
MQSPLLAARKHEPDLRYHPDEQIGPDPTPCRSARAIPAQSLPYFTRYNRLMQNVRIIRSRRKTLSIEIRPGGEVWVRAPQRLPASAIEQALTARQNWIQRKISEVKEIPPLPTSREFLPGERFLYRGQEYPLSWSERKKPALTLEKGGFFLARSVGKDASEAFETWYRDEARRILTMRLAELSTQTGLYPERMRLSSARTRWGSCSTNGTLSLNWRLILAPPEILDYVILHELSHIKVKNHSRAFWGLLETFLPDYRLRRKWLKDNGQELIIQTTQRTRTP